MESGKGRCFAQLGMILVNTIQKKSSCCFIWLNLSVTMWILKKFYLPSGKHNTLRLSRGISFLIFHYVQFLHI